MRYLRGQIGWKGRGENVQWHCWSGLEALDADLKLPHLWWLSHSLFLLYLVFWKLQNHVGTSPICPTCSKHSGHWWPCHKEVLLARWPLSEQDAASRRVLPLGAHWRDAARMGNLGRSSSVMVRLPTLTLWISLWNLERSYATSVPLWACMLKFSGFPSQVI